MYVSLVSLILTLTLMTTQVREAIAPPPLRDMARALIAAHSYRIVFRTSQTINNSVIIINTAVVRHGTTAQTYAMIASGMHGQKPRLLTEHIETGTQECDRATRAAPWQCTPWPRATHASLVRLVQNPTLRGLHWVMAPESIVHGQLCRSYRTTWQPAAGVRTQARLWIARASGRPVEVTTTTVGSATSAGGKTTTNTTTETATWSEWNSSALRIPQT